MVDQYLEKLLQEAGSDTAAYRLVSEQAGICIEGSFGGEIYGMEVDQHTCFDIASLTKLFTATIFFRLYERGVLTLSTSVRTFFPELQENLTIYDLLTHQSSFQIYLSELRKEVKDPVCFKEKVLSAPLSKKRVYLYQDPNYLVLGWLLERVSGKRLDTLLQEEVVLPLGLQNTMFGPIPEKNTVPTQIHEERGEIRGEVHDPTSYLLGHVTGHAGIFSTVEDLAVFSRMWLHFGKVHQEVYLQKTTVEEALFSGISLHEGFRQVCGWKQHSVLEQTPVLWYGGYMHAGHTGTLLIFDPEKRGYFVLLTNYIYPHGRDPQKMKFKDRYPRLKMATEYLLQKYF